MARRIGASFWTQSFQRAVGAMTRATVREGAKAMRQAAHSAITQRDELRGPGEWISGLAVGPGGREQRRRERHVGRRHGAPQALESGTAWPPLLVIHGGLDHVVSSSNAHAAAQLWAQAAGARAVAGRRVRRGKRHEMTVTDFKVKGRTVATLCEVDGLGHAWSGGSAAHAFGDARGPDASRMAWAFAARQFSAVR